MDGKNNNKHTIVDLFSGVGGLSMGFQQEGFELLMANDNDHNAAKTFIKNHPGIPFFEGDIKKLDESQIKKLISNKKVDVLVGGVPCQSFSMAGNRIRKNIDDSDDPRHFLFREFMRVTKILNPKIAIIENVKGILSSHNGKIKDEIIREFKKLGYDGDFRLLNAADYGVPQLRHRVVFVANKIGVKNIFPKKTHTEKNYFSVCKAIKGVPKLNHNPRQLTGITLKRIKLVKPGENWKSLPLKMQTKSRHSGAYGRIDPTKPSRTLTTRFDSPPVGYVTHPKEDRTLTVREGARIQTFPDNFEFTGNNSAQYKQVGNAVPPKMSRAIAKQIKKMLA